MANSILQDKKECFITKGVYNLHCHHIFMGNPNKSLSEMYGLKVYLIAPLHNQSDYGVHGKYGHDLDAVLKHLAQTAYMDLGHTVEQFREIFGKSYLLSDIDFEAHSLVVTNNVRLL